MNFKSIGIASLIGGIFMAVLSRIPIINLGNCLFCGWLWSGGILAVWVYNNQEGLGSEVSVGEGALIGAAAGVVGAVLGSLINIVTGGTLISSFTGYSEAFASFVASAFFSVIGFCLNIFIYPFFSTIGGVIGGVLFKSQN